MRLDYLHETAWAEVRLVLSPSDFMKAAKLGGAPVSDEDLLERWRELTDDPEKYAFFADTAAATLHTLLSEFAFQAVFYHPSPFHPD